MKYSILSLIFMFFAGGLWAQSIDKDRMNKDLEVAGNVLSTLLSQDDDIRVNLWSNRKIKGSYVDDYGVIFEVPGSAYNVFSYVPRGKNTNRVIVAPKAKSKTIISDVEGIAVGEAGKEDTKNVFMDFLIDYGHLIRQLKSTDKIMVKTSPGDHGNRFAFAYSGGKKAMAHPDRISVEVQIADLNDYEDGKMDRKALMDKIVVNESSFDPDKEPEIEVFATMLQRLYKTDLSNTYYMTSTPYYDRIDDFGVTYYLKFYSSHINDDLYYIPTIDKGDLNKEERNEIIDDMYTDFLQDIKTNMLDYGYILKSLEDDERLMLSIKLTECEGCEMPQEIEVSVKKSIIEDYRDEKINESQALNAIQVKKIK